MKSLKMLQSIKLDYCLAVCLFVCSQKDCKYGKDMGIKSVLII